MKFAIEFDVIKEVAGETFGLEISPIDFIDLINTAAEEEGFRLETTGDGIKCMINDEEICEMIVWEMKHECTVQQEEANI